MALTDLAHTLIRTHFSSEPKLSAVDATCGNGLDTEFLVKLGFHRIHAFDIQSTAIQATKDRLSKDKAILVELHQTNHKDIASFVDQKVDCIMFNFGYLPGGDKTITTTANTTIHALNSASKLLNCGGLMSLMCYPGHPNGAIETKAIKEWLSNLEDNFIVETHLAESPKPTAPILYLVKLQR